MRAKVNYIGKRFDYLLAIDELPKKCNQRYFECKCDCGNIKTLYLSSLLKTTKNSHSCGCKRVVQYTQKQRENILFNVWRDMVRRCFEITHQSYNNYGSRGIKVCNEWKNDFMNFYNWSMTNGYQKGLSIDRIDNNGNYEPNNCRWATMKVQNNNRRTNKFLVGDNIVQTQKQWAEQLKISIKRIKNRLRKGWAMDDIIYENTHNLYGCKKIVIRSDGVIYNSIIEAGKQLKIVGSHISDCCKGKRRTTGGYGWKYYSRIPTQPTQLANY